MSRYVTPGYGPTAEDPCFQRARPYDGPIDRTWEAEAAAARQYDPGADRLRYVNDAHTALNWATHPYAGTPNAAMRPIDLTLSDLENAVRNLSLSLDGLVEKLEPVRYQRPVNEEGGGGVKQPQFFSPFQSKLLDTIAYLDGLARRIESVKGEVEL